MLRHGKDAEIAIGDAISQRHRQGSTDIRGRTWILAGFLSVALAAGGAYAWLSSREIAYDRAASEVGDAFLKLERAIGYTGFIHHFKNFVLRPGEDMYFDWAVADYEVALDQLDRLEAIIAEQDLEIDLSRLRGTLMQYRSALDVAAEARARGAGIREIDALVRISDEAATHDIENLEARFETFLDARAAAQRFWRSLQLGILVTALICGAASVFYYMRRDAADAIRRSRDRLEAVFSAVSGAVIGLDAGRNVVTLNPPGRVMLDMGDTPTPFPWPGKLHFLRAEDLQPLDAPDDPVGRALKGARIDGETHLLASGDDAAPGRYVRVSSAPVGARESGLRTVVVVDDITEQERNRQQVERKGRLDALGQLTGGIAHDFNNVLATILYATELAMKDKLPDRAENLMRQARRAIDRARGLTSRLMAFAKRRPGVTSSRQVGAVFQDLEELVRTSIEEHMVLEFEPPEEDVRVYCDHGQLENALLNLVFNSRDAILRSGKGGCIRLTARTVFRDEAEIGGSLTGSPPEREPRAEQSGRGYRFVEISVTDDGPGMSAAVRQRATDPFFTTKDPSSGTGLALSLVYGFVQQSGGEMKIYSELGQGTTVMLVLPCGTDDDRREESHERPEAAMGDGERVLLVEDEDDLLSMTGQLLEDLGYSVTSTDSGDHAWQMIEQGAEFDVLLSDVVMPGETGGFELARLVRERMPDKPVVLLSGYAGFSAGELGGPDVILLQKPCLPEDLATALRTALRK